MVRGCQSQSKEHKGRSGPQDACPRPSPAYGRHRPAHNRPYGLREAARSAGRSSRDAAPGLPLPVTGPAHPRPAASGAMSVLTKQLSGPPPWDPGCLRAHGGRARARRGLAGRTCPQPGSRLQALQVLRQRVLLDVLLDVPAREVGLQVLLHHEVQGSLRRQRERSVPTLAATTRMSERGLGTVGKLPGAQATGGREPGLDAELFLKHPESSPPSTAHSQGHVGRG